MNGRDLSAYERILDRLDGVKRNGTKATSKCPAHDDHTPSLSITKIEGQILVYDHAGCDIEKVLDAIGWTKADLYDNPKGATYRYDDGRIVHRTPDKQFPQYGNKNGQPTLYRRAKVTEAVKNRETILLVEGEKDVHTLEGLGIVATTAPMGADSFHKADVPPLYGAEIIAIVDNDEKGENVWVPQVLAKLDGKAKSLDFAKSAVGKDISDHIAAGYTLAEIVPWYPPDDEPVSEEPKRRIRLTPASAIKPRPVRWAWIDRIPVGEITLTPGRGGLGKSTFHVWLIAHITRGTLPGVHFGTPKPCIIAASEDSWERTIVPRLIAIGADLDLVHRVDVVTETDELVSISLPRDVEALTEEIIRIGVGLLSVDPVMSVLSSGLDTHKDREVRLALEPLGRLADRTGCVALGNAALRTCGGDRCERHAVVG
jgi:hypothetical protein